MKFLLGMVFGFALIGCAGLSFPYKFYDPQFESYSGTLLGPTAKDDLPGDACAPTDSIKHPCVIMMATEFYSLKADYEDMQNRLNHCQSPPAPH